MFESGVRERMSKDAMGCVGGVWWRGGGGKMGGGGGLWR